MAQLPSRTFRFAAVTGKVLAAGSATAVKDSYGLFRNAQEQVWAASAS